jgi:hypothetical protein
LRLLTRFWYAPTGIHHPCVHTDSYCFGNGSCDCSRSFGMHQPVFTFRVCTQTRTALGGNDILCLSAHNLGISKQLVIAHEVLVCTNRYSPSVYAHRLVRGFGMHQPVFTIRVCTRTRTALGKGTAVAIAHEVLVFTNRYSPSACAHRFVLLWDGNSS